MLENVFLFTLTTPDTLQKINLTSFPQLTSTRSA